MPESYYELRGRSTRARQTSERSVVLKLGAIASGLYFVRYLWWGVDRLRRGFLDWQIWGCYGLLLGAAGVLLAVVIFYGPILERFRTRLAVFVCLLWGLDWLGVLAIQGVFTQLLVQPFPTLFEPDIYVLRNVILGVASLYLGYSAARDRNVLVASVLVASTYSFNEGYEAGLRLWMDIVRQEIKIWNTGILLEEFYNLFRFFFMLATFYWVYRVMRKRPLIDVLQLASVPSVLYGVANIMYTVWAGFSTLSTGVGQRLPFALVVRLPFGAALISLGTALLSVKKHRGRSVW